MKPKIVVQLFNEQELERENNRDSVGSVVTY